MPISPEKNRSLRGVACETVIACDENLCLTLKAADFLALLEEDEEVRRWGDREKELLRDNAQVGRLRSGENNFTPSPHHPIPSPSFAVYFRNHCSLIEIYDLLGAELQRRGKTCEMIY
ncbi:hypothetical protein QUB80_01995 [Chlorogloeopsis sp. ULAP01]|uniref:hypothetical protein n=1 Tax=Chlorogloeopsis sp. ULAP01 TaxID=3056483 RepID=UPI0025AA9659|nr:hypothetical protein [Chlorogloeopsis sp. ULAP01]MDM9379473.1 hypothetical protein [Chlorogloeopsis sp. ULAP01]